MQASEKALQDWQYSIYNHGPCAGGKWNYLNRMTETIQHTPVQIGSSVPSTKTGKPRDPVPDRLEPTLFGFIYKYSLYQQIGLLLFTVLSFPVIYISLELPKTIMDEAIRGEGSAVIELFGQSLSRVEFLWLLSFGLALALLTNGLMKMKLNTWKGIVGERLLRRLRYRLLTHVMRFAPGGDHKQRQGELVAMITSEVEPLGGIMGDALAQPVFQAGQMITILGFLFIQNVWLGLSAVATIPIQAIVIPILQRRINRLHRKRVLNVRELADHIGDTTRALQDLRAHGGIAWTLAGFSNRLGLLYQIRFDIFKQKFFMKFLNNMIGNLTPLTFYAIGGYLVIQGELSVGALVVALAAYKDIADPWRELLTYINQVQESVLRYATLSERFNRQDLLPASLTVNEPDDRHVERGDIVFEDVVVEGVGEDHLLCNLNFKLRQGAMVAFEIRDTSERRAFADLFVRERMPASGTVQLGGTNLNDYHLSRLAESVGLASSDPALVKGTIVENIQMSIRRVPDDGKMVDSTDEDDRSEAVASGNFPVFQGESWVRFSHAGVTNQAEFIGWWRQLIDAMDMTPVLSRRALDMSVHEDSVLAYQILEKRDMIIAELGRQGLYDLVEPFLPNQYHTGLCVGENLLYAITPRDDADRDLRISPQLKETIERTGLKTELETVAVDLLSTLMKVFGSTGPEHPLFRRLSRIKPADFEKLKHLKDQLKNRGLARLSEEEWDRLMILPFLVTADQFGSALSADLRGRILSARMGMLNNNGQCDECGYAALNPKKWNSELSVLENIVFGKLANRDEKAVLKLKNAILDLLDEEGVLDRLAALNYESPVEFGGENLQKETQERIALVRAVIRRPKLLVLESVLSTHDSDMRHKILSRLRSLLPDTTMVVVESRVISPKRYERVYRIVNGRIVDAQTDPEVFEAVETPAAADLEHKRRLLSKVDSFQDLREEQIRLLAYASDWVEKKAGEAFFTLGDDPDSAYVIKSGRAEIRWPEEDNAEARISEVLPGRLIGDLTILLNQPRNLDLIAVEDCKALRIGAKELDDIIRSDVSIAVNMLDTVAGHLIDMSDRYRELSNSRKQM